MSHFDYPPTSFAPTGLTPTFFSRWLCRAHGRCSRRISPPCTWLAAVGLVQTQVLRGDVGSGRAIGTACRSRPTIDHRAFGAADTRPKGTLFIYATALGANLPRSVGFFGFSRSTALWSSRQRACHFHTRPFSSCTRSAGWPHAQKDAARTLKVAMRGLARTEFLWQRIPLATCAGCTKCPPSLAPIGGRAAPHTLPFLSAAAITRLRLRQQRLDSFPETIRQFPTGDVGVLRQCLFRCCGQACILRPKAGLEISSKLKEVPFQAQLFRDLVATNGDIDWVITNRPAET